MKQIGARQEAGRIGGLGPCRRLCCSGWMTSFVLWGLMRLGYKIFRSTSEVGWSVCQSSLKCCLNFGGGYLSGGTEAVASSWVGVAYVGR